MNSHLISFLLMWDMVSAGALVSGGAKQPTPGGALVVSDRLVNHLVARPIDESERIAHTLMGTYTEGTLVTQGHLEVQFIPATGRGVLELRLRGTATLGSGIGYSGPVTIYSSSKTSIDARKQIALTSSGLRWQPSEVGCSTQIAIHGIEARRRIVERLAWRKAGRMQPSVERAASRQAELKTAQSMDSLVDRGLGTGNGMLEEKLGPTARKLDLSSRLQISSTSSRLHAVMFPSARVPARVGNYPPINRRHDGAITLHELLVGDVGRTLLSDVTVRDDEMLAMMKLLVGDAPRPLWVHAREPRWSVTFAQDEPFCVRFSDQQVRFRLRIAHVQIEDEKTELPLMIAADYRLQISEDGPVLIREGQVKILNPNEALPPQRTAAEGFVRRKFRGVLLPEIRLLGLIPPAGSNWNPLRSLELKELTSRDGWLTLGYQIPENSTRAPLPVTLAPTAIATDDTERDHRR